jgi:hypothetical protein
MWGEIEEDTFEPKTKRGTMLLSFLIIILFSIFLYPTLIII